MIRSSLSLLFLGASACSVTDLVAVIPEGDGGPSDVGAGPGDGGPPHQDAGDGGRDAGMVVGPGCDAAGSVLEWDVDAAPFGLCVCGDMTAADAVTLDGSAAVAGTLAVEGPFTAGGGLRLSGTLSATAQAPVAARELYATGGLQSDAAVLTERVVGLGAGARATRIEAPLGLSLPPGAALNVSSVIGPVERGPAPPFDGCDCAPIDEDPVRGEGGDPGTLVGDVEVPCGPSRRPALIVDRGTTWTITAPTQLVIEGNASFDDDLTVVVEPGARLDLVVEGDLVSAGRLVLGSEEGPVNLRVQGSGTLQLSADVLIFGDLDAPASFLVSNAPLDIRGRLRVRQLNAVNEVRIGGADAELSAGQTCSDDFACAAPSICVVGRCER